MEINTAVKEAHEIAKEKGWWDFPRSPAEIHMLIVTEIAEATEAIRNPLVAEEEGEREELADAVIRIMDYFGYKGWDLSMAIQTKMIINRGRAYRHGGKLI